MVGGRSPLAQDERLLRFDFPERPGALMRFLSAMQPDWNISLFHYRNQGQISVGSSLACRYPSGIPLRCVSFLRR